MSSGDSEEEFSNLATKIPTSSPNLIKKKPSKLSKLKLRLKKDKGASSQNASNELFTKLKPVATDPVIDVVLCESIHPMCEAQDTTNEVDLSVAEPDLIVHSILSQETVIVSSCECTSSQEFTESFISNSPPAPTKHLSVDEDLPSKTIENDTKKVLEPVSLNGLKERVEKRRLTNESFVSEKKKKTKFDGIDDEIRLLNEKTDEAQDSPRQQSSKSSFPLTETLPLTEMVVEKEIIVYTTPESDRISSLHSDREKENPPFAIPNIENLSTDTEDIRYDQGLSKEITTHESKDYIPVVKPPPSPLPPGKPLKKDSQNKADGKSKPSKLSKTSLAKKKSPTKDAKEKSRGKLKTTTRPAETAVCQDNFQREENAISKAQPLNEVSCESPKKNFESRDSGNFKSPTPPSKDRIEKQISKTPIWNPPGMVRSRISTPTGNSPAIGLRLGLSRNRKTNKPLHPDVKLKL